MRYALVIPVHLPKFQYLISFLQSAMIHHSADVKIVLVTSGPEHTEKLAALLAAHRFHKLDLQVLDVLDLARCLNKSHDFLMFLANNTNLCIVPSKKFLALWWCCTNNIDYAIAQDVDTLCVASLQRFFQQSVLNYQSGIYLGKRTVPEHGCAIQALDMSGKLLAQHDYDAIRTKGVQDVWHWFLDPPGYMVADLREFFHYMEQQHGGLDKFIQHMNWWIFDQILFSQWRVAKDQAQVRDYGDPCNIEQVPEGLSFKDILRITLELGYSPCWINMAAWLQNSQQILTQIPSISMLYHTDRTVL